MKDRILNLRLEGKSYNEIKDILGCSKSTISYHCSKIDENEKIKSSNLTIKNKKQIKDNSFLLPSGDIINKIINMRKVRKKYKEISNELGLSFDIVSKTCRKLGISLTRRKFRNLDEEIVFKIKELYKELKSTRKVAEILRISRDSVRKYVEVERLEKMTEEELKQSNSKKVIEWRKRTKLKLVEYKGGECSICGYKRSLKALEFHHIDPNEKDFTISGKSFSYERLKKEVDKCILVCSNCHAEIHEKEINGL